MYNKNRKAETSVHEYCMSTGTSALWVATGKHNTCVLSVCDAIAAKELAWFGEKAAAEPSPNSATDELRRAQRVTLKDWH
jgi:hypothetical protein